MAQMKLKVLNVVFFIIALGVNYLPMIHHRRTPFKPIGHVADEYDTVLTPPHWTFAIWGVIYAYLAIFLFCQFFSCCDLDSYVEKLSGWFICSCLCNAGWVLLFSLGTKISISGSVLMILMLLFSLMKMQQRAQFLSRTHSKAELFIADFSLSIYLGWVIVATFLNIAVCYVAWSGHHPHGGPEFGHHGEHGHHGHHGHHGKFGMLTTALSGSTTVSPSNDGTTTTFHPHGHHGHHHGPPTEDKVIYCVGLGLAFLFHTINLFKNGGYVTKGVFFYVLTSLLSKFHHEKHLFFYYTISTTALSLIMVIIKTTMDCVNNRRQQAVNFGENYATFDTNEGMMVNVRGVGNTNNQNLHNMAV